jgi:hypothetical protein
VTPPFCPGTISRARYDLEVYSDAWAAEQVARAQYLEDCADEAAEEQSDDEARERLESLEQERDEALERFERAVEPYLNIRPLKRRPTQHKKVAA